MAGINVLIQRLERMAASDVKHRIMQKVTPVAHDECLRGFREQRNPYGVPWAPRKDKRGSWALLDKSGDGIESLTSRTVDDKASLRFGRSYMRFHQTGAHHNARSNIATKRTTGEYEMPARKIFPEQTEGLGTWSAPINRAAVDAVREMCEGKR